MKNVKIFIITLILVLSGYTLYNNLNQEQKLGGYSPTQNLVISSGGGIEIYTGAGVIPSITINNEGILKTIKGELALISSGRIFVPNDFGNNNCNTKCATYITTNNTSGTGAFLCLSSLYLDTNTVVNTTLITSCSTFPGAGRPHMCLCFGEID